MATDRYSIPYINILDNNVLTGSTVFSPAVVLNSNRNYRVNIVKGSDASSAYTRTHLKAWKPAEYISASLYKPTKSLSSAYSSLAGVVSSSGGSASYDAIALERFRKAIRSSNDSFKLLAPLAEARELHTTISGMMNLTGQFLHTVVNAKRALRRPKDFRRFAQDAWLTYSFGISPTVRDAQALGQSIASYISRRDRSVRIARGYSYNYNSLSLVYSSPTVASGFTTGNIKISGSTNRTVNYVGGYDYNVASSNDYSIFDHLGFTPDQIPGTAWELLGLSWVVDYFVNVGDFIDDVFTATPAKQKYLVRTVVERTDASYVDDIKWGGGTDYLIVNRVVKPGVMSTVSVTRTLLATLPSATLRFRTMSEIGRPAYAVSRILNLASLLGRK